jgi:hypothetical protein
VYFFFSSHNPLYIKEFFFRWLIELKTIFHWK